MNTKSNKKDVDMRKSLSPGERSALSLSILILSILISPLLTYLLTPLSGVLLEKLTGPQSVKKFPAFYETRRFITAFTITRHLSLS